MKTYILIILTSIVALSAFIILALKAVGKF